MRSWTPLRFGILLLLLAISLVARGEVPVTVTVVDDFGAPVAQATVRLSMDDGSAVEKVTGADGTANFNVRAGRVTVTAFLHGFAISQAVGTASDSRRLSFRLMLEGTAASNKKSAKKEHPTAITTTSPPLTYSYRPAPEPSMPSPAPEPYVLPAPKPAMAPPRPPIYSVPAAAAMSQPAQTVVPFADETADVAPGKDYATVQIYYATDRAFTGDMQPASAVFGARRGKVTRGIAHVSIPRLHRIGNIESASVLRFEFHDDPKKHIVLLNVIPQRDRDFYAKLRASVARSKKHEAFVFIHGFDNTFADAAKRTAQIKYDLAFDGPAIAFSWPSMGSPKPMAYTADENNAEWAIPHFRDFLLELAQNSGAQSISVVAHSMGNRVLARAFERLPETQQPQFDQIVLTAPDIDVDVFKSLADAIRKPARHVTLYVSKNDEALRISKSLHGDIPRAGDSSQSVLVVAGMETVDVSKVDTSFIGHSYIGENRTVLADVFCLIRGSTLAARRCRLVSHGSYWEFVGQLEDVASLAQYACSAPGCRLSAHP